METFQGTESNYGKSPVRNSLGLRLRTEAIQTNLPLLKGLTKTWSGQEELQVLLPGQVRCGTGLIAQCMVLIAARAITTNDRPVNANNCQTLGGTSHRWVNGI